MQWDLCGQTPEGMHSSSNHRRVCEELRGPGSKCLLLPKAPSQVGPTSLIHSELSHTEAKRDPARLENICVCVFKLISLHMLSPTIRFIKLCLSWFYSFKFCLHSLYHPMHF